MTQRISQDITFPKLESNIKSKIPRDIIGQCKINDENNSNSYRDWF